MSTISPSTEGVEQKEFACAPEASALLNCVTGKSYNELKCLPLLKKLRTCVEKKNVVDFTLTPPQGKDSEQAAQSAPDQS
ncbi:hypothetical protein WJX73_010594 [Symbiochloris irregularis]|uniref:Cox19-like CHCH family protein n=1 Tax=Symbiochloris irregularis TaxID=706552 RepID=A0AAW1PBS9_9CHLO